MLLKSNDLNIYFPFTEFQIDTRVYMDKRKTHMHHHQSFDRFGRWGDMRDGDTEILLQSGMLCAFESNSTIGRDAHDFTWSI